METELDLILRLRYEVSKNQNYFKKSDKKEKDEFYFLLDELEKHMKNLLRKNF